MNIQQYLENLKTVAKEMRSLSDSLSNTQDPETNLLVKILRCYVLSIEKNVEKIQASLENRAG